MRLVYPAVFALVALPWAAAGAQDPDAGIPSAARVRISAPALSVRPLTGRYDGVDRDSLSLSLPPTGSRLRIPLAEVTRLEVSDGRNRGRGAAVGALVGLGVGVVGGILCTALCPTDAGGGANLAAAGGLAAGVVVGIPVGAIVGGGVFAPERWRPIPVPLR